MAHVPVPADVLELADLLRPTWPAHHAALIASGVPLCEGDPDPEPEPDPKPKADPELDPDPDPDPEPAKDPDWKSESRKHERRAKAAAKRAEELEAKLKERDDADKSEQEKAIEKAREEAKAEALTEAQQERRKDRLEVAATRAAARGIELGEGDEAETVKFADPDDAQIYLQRAIDSGDVDLDEIFDDDGKVQTAAVESALAEILEHKPHLKAGTNGSAPSNRPKGSGDGGKGDPGKSLEEMSAEEHFQRIRRK